MSSGVLPIGHRSRGAGLSSDRTPDLERAILMTRNFGRTFFVDSNVLAAGDGLSPQSALTTIQAAVNAATPGETIYVAPGHAESITSATVLAVAKAGLSIVGLGRGARRPTLTFGSAATANIPISGANVRFENFLLTVTGTLDVTAAITVTGADVELVDIEIRDASATSQIATGIVLGTGADRAYIGGGGIQGFGYVYRGVQATGDAGAAGISCAVAIDGVVIENAFIDGLLANGGIYNVSNAMTNLTCRGCVTRNRHATMDSGINLVATTTGNIINCLHRAATHDADGFNKGFVGAAMQYFQSYVVNLDDESGGLARTASAAA